MKANTKAWVGPLAACIAMLGAAACFVEGDECSMDQDCKGNRICEDGECVDVSSPTGSSSASGGGNQELCERSCDAGVAACGLPDSYRTTGDEHQGVAVSGLMLLVRRRRRRTTSTLRG